MQVCVLGWCLGRFDTQGVCAYRAGAIGASTLWKKAVSLGLLFSSGLGGTGPPFLLGLRRDRGGTGTSWAVLLVTVV